MGQGEFDKAGFSLDSIERWTEKIKRSRENHEEVSRLCREDMGSYLTGVRKYFNISRHEVAKAMGRTECCPQGYSTESVLSYENGTGDLNIVIARRYFDAVKTIVEERNEQTS